MRQRLSQRRRSILNKKVSGGAGRRLSARTHKYWRPSTQSAPGWRRGGIRIHGALIPGGDIAPVFRIEMGCDLGRVDQVGEQNPQMTPLTVPCLARGRDTCCRRHAPRFQRLGTSRQNFAVGGFSGLHDEHLRASVMHTRCRNSSPCRDFQPRTSRSASIASDQSGHSRDKNRPEIPSRDDLGP